MKNSLNQFVLFGMLLLMLSVSACMGEIKEINSTSEDGFVEIKINGEPGFVFDPIMVRVKIIIPNVEEGFSVELAATSLTEENCQVMWDTNRKGAILLTQSDDTQKRLNFKITEERIVITQDLSYIETLF